MLRQSTKVYVVEIERDDLMPKFDLIRLNLIAIQQDSSTAMAYGNTFVTLFRGKPIQDAVQWRFCQQ